MNHFDVKLQIVNDADQYVSCNTLSLALYIIYSPARNSIRRFQM